MICRVSYSITQVTEDKTEGSHGVVRLILSPKETDHMSYYVDEARPHLPDTRPAWMTPMKNPSSSMQKGIRTPTQGRPCREYGIRTGSAEHSAPRSSTRQPSPIHAQLGRRRWRTRLPQCRRESTHQPRADPAENMGFARVPRNIRPHGHPQDNLPDTRPTRTPPMKNPSSSVQKGIRTPTWADPAENMGFPQVPQNIRPHGHPQDHHSSRPPSPIHAQLGRRRWRTRLPQCRRNPHTNPGRPCREYGIPTGSAEHSASRSSARPSFIKTTFPDTRPTL